MYIRAERHEYIDNINRLNKFVLSINPGVHILLCHTKTGRNDFDYANIDVSHHIYIAGIDVLILDLIFSTEQWDFHKLIDRRNSPEICRILQAAVRGLQSIFTMISRKREREKDEDSLPTIHIVRLSRECRFLILRLLNNLLKLLDG